MAMESVGELSKKVYIEYHNGKSERCIIFLAGIPGSGKTTLATQLKTYIRTHLDKEDTSGILSLSMDGFHLTKLRLSQTQDPIETFKRRGAPFTFDVEALIKTIQKLKDVNEELYWPSFDHKVGDPVEEGVYVSKKNKLIILEGNYLLYDTSPWNQLKGYAKASWFLNCSLELAKQRLVKRHQQAGIEKNKVDATKRVETNDLLNAKLILENLAKPDKFINLNPSEV